MQNRAIVIRRSRVPTTVQDFQGDLERRGATN